MKIDAVECCPLASGSEVKSRGSLLRWVVITRSPGQGIEPPPAREKIEAKASSDAKSVLSSLVELIWLIIRPRRLACDAAFGTLMAASHWGNRWLWFDCIVLPVE
jgi:hypothetical protein